MVTPPYDYKNGSVCFLGAVWPYMVGSPSVAAVELRRVDNLSTLWIVEIAKRMIKNKAKKTHMKN